MILFSHNMCIEAFYLILIKLTCDECCCVVLCCVCSNKIKFTQHRLRKKNNTTFYHHVVDLIYIYDVLNTLSRWMKLTLFWRGSGVRICRPWSKILLRKQWKFEYVVDKISTNLSPDSTQAHPYLTTLILLVVRLKQKFKLFVFKYSVEGFNIKELQAPKSF